MNSALELLWSRMGGRPFFAEDAVAAYQEGKSVREIADEFDQQYETVRAILIRFGVLVPRSTPSSQANIIAYEQRKKIKGDDLAELWDQYTVKKQDGRFLFTVVDMAAYFDVSVSAIGSTLSRNFGDEYHKVRRERRHVGGSTPSFSREKAFDMLEDGKTTRQIAIVFGVRKSTIQRALRRLNPTRYRELVEPRITPQKIPTNIAMERYESGATLTELAERYSVFGTNLSKHLKKHHGRRFMDAYPHRGGPGRRVFPWEEAFNMWKDGGFSETEIARKYGVTQSCISKAFAKLIALDKGQ